MPDTAAQGREFCISCGEPVEGEWCPEPCHTDLRDSNNRVTCRRKHGVCNCPDCCGVRRSRATDPNLSDIPLHIRIAEDGQDARSAAQDRLPVQARADASGGGSRVTWRGLYKHDPNRATIPAIVGEAAWEGYAADGHGGQSCERLHQRGGFGLAELGYFLVRAVDEGRIKIEVVR